MSTPRKVTSARSVKYWLDKGYSEEHAKTMARSRMPGTPEYFEIFKGFTKDESIKKSKEWNSSKAVTEENFIKKYGVNEGRLRWNAYREKQAYSNTLEYKKTKHGWTDEQFEEFNKSRAVTLENLIKKHGLDHGTKKYNEYVETQKYTTSLEYFIKEYGETAGKEKYDRFCRLRQHSYESYLERFGGNEDLAIKELNKYYNTRPNNLFNSSAICKKFCSALHSKLNDVGDFTVFYEDYTREYYFGIPKYGRVVVDFFIKDYKKVIEFYGDYWHANPNIYNENSVIRYPKNITKTAKDVWQSDLDRISAIKSIGIDVLIVWEKDFREDPNNTIQTTVNWILNTHENN